MIALAALAASLALAQEAPKTGHWERKPTALLLFDADGGLASEHHLGASDDGAKMSFGGVSPDKRLSWVFEKTISWNAARTKVLGTQRRLRLLGSDGKTLWESKEADAPLEGGDVLRFSDDSELALYSERLASGWRLVARNYIGNQLLEAGPFAELQQFTMTKDGRYALARWTVPDQSATHTFLDLKTKARKDVASDTFALGQARLDDDGKVWSGGKVALDLAKELDKK